MRHNYNLVCTIGAILMFISCSADSHLNAKVEFNNQAGYVPAEISNWPHALFLFNSINCTDVQIAANEKGINNSIKTEANRATVIAYESDKNLNFGKTNPGGGFSEYFLSLKDVNGDIPQIWMQHSPFKDGKNTVSLKPLTSMMKINIIDAPKNLKSSEFILDKMTDALYLASGKTEAQKESQQKKILLGTGEQSKELALFPMLNSVGSWTLQYTLLLDNVTLTGEMEIDKGVKAGQTLELDIDFSKYTTESIYEVTYRFSTYNVNDWVEQRQEMLYIWPGDNQFVGKNPYYNVYVLKDNRWKSVEVRNALCSDAPNHHGEIWKDWDNSKQLRDTMCYANFTHDFDGAVKVRVQKRCGGFNSVQVRPSSNGISTIDCGNKTVEFSLPSWEKRKVSVEFDNDRYHNLFLFPNRPDENKPDPKAPGVEYYFGPGEHEVETITLTDNQTLYIDEGAILYTTIVVKGNNVTIAGRGILSGEREKHWGDHQYSWGSLLISVQGQGRAIQNFNLSGITIIDSPAWTVSVYNADHVNINNINIICWILNGDGIDFCSVTDGRIEDCFIRTYDDCITLKIRKQGDPVSDTKDIHIKNNLIWCDYARGIVVGPEAGDLNPLTGSITNCMIEDCVVLESTSGDGDQRSALTISQVPEYGGTAQEIRNITFRNILIDNLHVSGRPICIEQKPQQTGACYLVDVLFQNIQIKDAVGYRNPSLVAAYENFIKGLKFDNVTYNGEKILGPSSKLNVSGNVEISYK